MANATFQPKIYRSQGSTSFVVASGGSVEVESGGHINEQSGAVHEFNAGAVITLNGSTFLSSTGKVKVPYGFALPVETISSGEGSTHGKTLQAGSCIHILTASTATEWLKMPTPAAGDVKYVYQVGASGGIILESTNGAGHEWNSTGGNRITMLGPGAAAVFAATSSTGWRLIAGVTSTGGLWAITISTST